MVASFLRDFVNEPFVREMDCGTLECLSGEYVGKDFTRSFSGMVWRARWLNRRGATWRCFWSSRAYPTR